MKVIVKKLEKNLIQLIDAHEIEIFQYIPNEKVFTIKVTIERNLIYHKKFRGFLKTIYNTIPENLDNRFPTFKSFYIAILIATGTYTFNKDEEGEIEVINGSTSFANMDEIKYRDFVHNTILLISKNYFNLGNLDELIKILESYNYY